MVADTRRLFVKWLSSGPSETGDYNTSHFNDGAAAAATNQPTSQPVRLEAPWQIAGLGATGRHFGAIFTRRHAAQWPAYLVMSPENTAAYCRYL